MTASLLLICAALYGGLAIASPTAISRTKARASSDSWQQYVRAPSSDIVAPTAIVSSLTTGNVTNPEGFLQDGGSTILSRPQPQTPPSWPSGTSATASSFHAPNTGDGQARTYDPSNAIDGDITTFWNDDTEAAYPDILTINAPSALSLDGITVVSNTDGVPVDFIVETLQSDNSWSLAGTVTGNSAVEVLVPFASTVSTSGIRITVTQDQPIASAEYTRINEVYPGLVQSLVTPTIVVDFGINVVGFPQISFGGASSNSPGIRLAFSETLQYLSETSDFSRSDNGDTITPGSDQIAVSATPYVWTDTYGCVYGTQVCSDGLHGFRYMRISLDALASDSPYTTAYGDVTIDSISLNYTAFLGTPDTFTGWFECSDEQLSQFWFDAAYTNDMVIDTFRANDTDPRGAGSSSLIGKLVIFDGAKRDRDPYVGDLAVSARTAYLTHDVAEAARNVLADLADHQRSDGWIPPASLNEYTLPLFDYPLHWVVCSYDLLVYTGDTAYAQQYYTTLQNVLNNWYPSVTNTATSLLDKDVGGASSYGDYAFLPRQGTITYYNSLYVLALNYAAKIATFLGGHDDDATEWTQRAATVSAAINTYLWDSSTGAYFDSLADAVSHAQDGNSISVLASVSSADQTSSLLAYLDTKALPYGNPFYDNDPPSGGGFSERVYAFISYFEIQARFVAGSASTALDQIRRTYGWMSTNDPTVTFWEGIGSGGSMYEGAFTSAAHGWSTGVLPALTNFVLGVIPTGPGFQSWTIKPIVGDVTWAQGVVPTPQGPLSVSWTVGTTSPLFNLDIAIPTGTQGDVSVPVSDQTNTVTVDGTSVWNGAAVGSSGASFADGYVTVPVTTSGNHTIAVQTS